MTKEKKRILVNGVPKKDIMKLVNKAIDESTITSEASAAALMTEAVAIVLTDIDQRMRSIYAAHGMLTKRNGEDIMSGMKAFQDAVRLALGTYERSIRAKFEDYTFGYNGAESYDSFRRSANDVARIILKLCDKGKVDGVLRKIESYINRFKPQGRFTEEDYNRFILR